MSEVTTRTTDDGYDVLVDEEVAHSVETEQQAEQLAAWLKFQLGQGVELEMVLGMLRGEPAGEPASNAPELDTSVLEGTIRALKKALASGKHDGELAGLLEFEEGERARRGAIAALKARMSEIG